MKKFVHHLCIQTNDYQKSLAFYQKLGFALVAESEGFHNRKYNSWLQLGECYIELQTGKNDQPLAPVANTEGITHFCLWVEDLEAEVKALEEYKESFIQKQGGIIYYVENSPLCKLRAPEGTIIELRDTANL